jgi:pilus assembly protein Flp/PilA
MKCLVDAFARFLKREEGPTAVEYAFLAFLIIVVCMIAIVSLGQNTNGLYSNNAAKITNPP